MIEHLLKFPNLLEELFGSEAAGALAAGDKQKGSPMWQSIIAAISSPEGQRLMNPRYDGTFYDSEGRVTSEAPMMPPMPKQPPGAVPLYRPYPWAQQPRGLAWG